MNDDIVKALETLIHFSEGAYKATKIEAFWQIVLKLIEISNRITSPETNEEPEVSEEEKILETYIMDIDYFTVRTHHCLQAENIITLKDLIAKSAIDLLKIPNLGKKSLKEIEDYLKKIGLSLKEYKQSWQN